jgi:hypothetical protein
MPGKISLAFHREPSFFTAEKVGCIRSETIICRKSDTGTIIGFGGRSLRLVYLEGKERTMWYLHTLRLIPEERNGIALMRGYQHFHSMQNGSMTPYFFTTILDGNIHAKNVLENGRGGMPVYTRVGTLKTYLIPIRTSVGSQCLNANVFRVSDLTVRSACESINEWNSDYELAPVYKPEDLMGISGMLPHFNRENLYVAKRGGKIAGTFGIWDQSRFKQTVVHSYSKDMQVARAVSNVWSFVRGLPYLPKTQSSMKILHGSFLSVRNNNREMFDALINRAVCDWSGQGYDWLAVGLCCGHPLEDAILKHSARVLSSGIYYVHWKEDNIVFPNKQRVFHLESSLL